MILSILLPDITGKRKRADSDSEDQEEYHAKTTKKPVAKKLRKTTGTRKTRKPKDAQDAFDPEQVAKETKINADNPLFSASICRGAVLRLNSGSDAVMNPFAALQSTAEDFLESLANSPGAAQAEFINLILRACGCNDSVDADEVVDYDGVVDALDNFTEGLKKVGIYFIPQIPCYIFFQDNSPTYPLTSKLAPFKKFRKSLRELLDRLVASSASIGSLYTSDLMSTLQTWVIAMSSSQIRSFRHTATVVALEVETALCDVAAGVEKEAELLGRQREGEKKRRKDNKSREKDLDAKAKEIRERRNNLSEFIKEFVDG